MTIEIDLIPVSDKPYFEDDIRGTVVELRDLQDECTHVFWTLDGLAVRVTFDNAFPPIAGERGHLLAAGSSGTWAKELAEAAQFVRDDDSGFAHIRVTQLLERT